MASYLDLITSPKSNVTRRVEIYESDGVTPWPSLDAHVRPFVDWNVNVDMARDERRTFDLVLDNTDKALRHYPGGFWYDKVIKIFRGVWGFNGEVYDSQLGEFMIDQINDAKHAPTISVTGRDYTKKLLTSKFAHATSFAVGQTLESVVTAIAVSGGVTRYIIPATGKTLGRVYLFEADTERWKAIADVCQAFGYEAYFNAQGYLVIREMRDPLTSPLSFTFATGYTPDFPATLANYEKSTNDARLFNQIIVRSESAGQVPIVGVATNTEPSSPTNINKIGIRSHTIKNSLITTQAQADDLASKMLKIYALEQFDLNTESLVIPWLEAGDIVGFADPDPSPGDPTRFLLSNFTIPGSLSGMKSNSKRVTIVGGS